jgi:hypothetical protein
VVVTALSGAGVTFQECVPLTALGLQTAISAAVAAEHGQDSVADLSFDELIDNARKHAAALSQSYGTGDSWGEHKRRLGALSEANAIALGHPALAAQLLEVALAVPVG